MRLVAILLLSILSGGHLIAADADDGEKDGAAGTGIELPHVMFLPTFMDYYRSDLKVEGATEYKVSAGLYLDWDWQHKQPNLQGFKLPFPNTSIDLGLAMTQNPGMQVLVQQGYYDLATPHLATEYYMDHLDIADELRDNIEIAYYEAGHMIYVHAPSLVKYKEDLAEFIRNSH